MLFQPVRLFSPFIRSIRNFATHRSTMVKALVILSEGAEEMETVISVDVLRRAEIDVTVAGLEGTGPVVCSRNVKIVPDVAFSEVKEGLYDAVVCPGGAKGAENMMKSEAVGEFLKKHEKEGRLIAAVCAGPKALASHKIASDKQLTSHPGAKDHMVKAGYNYSEERVVQDGKLITSRGPGTTFEFALKIVEALISKEKADSLVPPMLVKQ